MRLALWLRFAWRDLRSGLQGFWIFLTCLALGTAAIAIVGSLAQSIERGLNEQGQPLLGGDVEFALIHRQASDAERSFMDTKGTVSVAATMRAMAVAGAATTLVEVKSVDGSYPLYGALVLENASNPAGRLDPADGVFGAFADPLLLARLGVSEGSRVKLGAIEVEIRGLIATEPDRISDGIILGPRMLVSRAALMATGLVQPGSLITWRYRLKLPQPASLDAAKAVVEEAKASLPDAGWRLRTSDNAASGVERFIGRLSFFLTLVGLSALIVGGAGIANAVTAFVNRRLDTIATLKCLGARSEDVHGIFLAEIMMVALLAVAAGLLAGAAAPAVAASVFAGVIPLPVSGGIEVGPLAEAGVLGLLVALAFAIWPLSQTKRVRAGQLFRYRLSSPAGLPSLADLAVIAAALAAIAAVALASFGDRRLTIYYLIGLAASFVALLGLAAAIIRLARRMPRPASAIARYALTNIHRPGTAATSVIMALGLGLGLFVTLALTDRTIGNELRSNIPAAAPAFFFLDVNNSDLASFRSLLEEQAGVAAIGSAPMMRGRVVRVKGVPAEQVNADPDAAWALRGDRGLTYAEALPEGSTLAGGEWWPKDYDGPHLVSMVDEIASGIGVAIGDEITVNVLGREITAKVANLRQVDWRSLGINFVMVFSPNTLKAAPHSHIVTVEMNGGDEAALLSTAARAFPSVTAVRVKDALAIVTELLGQMTAAIRGANLLTLGTGILVLSGALAAGLSGRIYDAVVLKTYGATRRQLIGAFALEYAVLGLAAALFGVLVGSAASWFLARYILEMPWSFSIVTAMTTAAVAMAATVAAGLGVTWRALSARPAAVLRGA